MKLEQIKEIVETVEKETTMSQAMLKLIESHKLEESVKSTGYVPDPIEKVVNWLEETYDEVKAFVPFKYWNCAVLDKPWLNARRDEIEIRFATGGVFIRLEDFKRYVQHSIEAKYETSTIEEFQRGYDRLTENDGVELGFGSLESSDKYVQAFGDMKIKLMKSRMFKTARPLEIVDAGSRIVLEKLSNSVYDFEELKDQLKNKTFLKNNSGDDFTNRVYKVDPKFNFVKVYLLGDTSGSMCKDKTRKETFSKEEHDRMVAEFLAKKNGRVA